MAGLPKGRIFKRKRIWYYHYEYQNKPYTRSLKTTNKIHAEEDFKHLMAQVTTAIFDDTFNEKFGDGSVIQTTPSDQSLLSNAWPEYLASVNRPDSGQSTLRQYEFQWDRFLKWMNEKYPNVKLMASVTKIITRQFASELSETVSPNTFNKYRNLLHLIFRVWGDNADAMFNPWEGIVLKKLHPQSKRAFTQEELKMIFQNANGELKTLCLLAYHSGLRLGDCCTLQWNCIDMVAKKIRVTPRKTARTSGHSVVIPIHYELFEHLSSMWSPFIKGYVCPDYASHYLNDDATVADRFKQFFKKCGIETIRKGTGKGTGKRAVVEVGFHSFRHTWVTMSAENGMDAASIRTIVGWGSPAMEKVYTHISPEHLAEAVNKNRSVSDMPTNKSSRLSNENDIPSLSAEELKHLLRSIQDELERRSSAVAGHLSSMLGKAREENQKAESIS